MHTVGIRELKQHTSRILRQVREEGREVLVTYRGRAIARLVPVSEPAPAAAAEAWTDLDALAEEIGALWPDGVTASEAVEEGRRSL